MARKRKPTGGMEPNNALTVEQTTEETGAQAMARKLLQPTLKNAAAASAFTDKMMGRQVLTRAQKAEANRWSLARGMAPPYRL